MTGIVDYRRDMAPFRRAAGELLRLAGRVPGGLAGLRDWYAAQPEGAAVYSERIEDGVLLLVAEPSPAMLTYLAELRAGAAGMAAE